MSEEEKTRLRAEITDARAVAVDKFLTLLMDVGKMTEEEIAMVFSHPIFRTLWTR